MQKVTQISSRPKNSLRLFLRREDGSFIIFSLFVLVAMLLATGMAFDVVRSEVARTKLQNTLDRAVLAAADLDQTLNGNGVVEDYFERAGIMEYLGTVATTEGLNYRTVTADSEVDMQTRFLKMVGLNSIQTRAVGTANETITDVEISLVLDNSGSMGSNNRLNLLKDAAKAFVDIVVPDSEEEAKVSINIVPFSTQVSAGPDLLKHFNVSDEHDYSDCVNFSDTDFDSSSLSTTAPLQRTGHFDVFSWSKPIDQDYLVCPTDPNRHIRVMGNSRSALKAKIDGMTSGGNTSIDVATKWGLALLDPTMRPVISSMIGEGLVDSDFEGRPFSYTEPQTMKVLVVMSDGENTSQYMLRDEYRSGDSPLFKDRENDRESYYYNRSGTSSDYYHQYGDRWRSYPYYNWDRAERQTWPEVWASRSVANFARYTVADAIGGTWSNYYNSYYTSVSPSTKNTRTSSICQAARDQGITVYTIGMDTYGQGDATLSDCASGEAFFFDVDGLQIGQAFSAIARDINRLRLTQ